MQNTPKNFCISCGITIEYSETSICLNCKHKQIDIFDGIKKHCNLTYCNSCERYLKPPNHWIKKGFNSKDLLLLCISKVKGLHKAKLVNACFIRTELHSQKIKIKLTIQKKAFSTLIVQQSYVINFSLKNCLCTDCSRTNTANKIWNSIVQVRQFVEHKRTFQMLEHLIVKHGADFNCSQIEKSTFGLNIYYNSHSQSIKFVNFMKTIAPIRYRVGGTQLVSHETHKNIFKVKHTHYVEIPPLCVDDIVRLPENLSSKLSNIGPIALCTKITNVMHIIDPITFLLSEITAKHYWESPFTSLMFSEQLQKYIILQMKPIESYISKHLLVNVMIAKLTKLGPNYKTFNVKTHLGYILRVGDIVFGYEMSETSIQEKKKKHKKIKHILPDVIIVCKSHRNIQDLDIKSQKWRISLQEKMTGNFIIDYEQIINQSGDVVNGKNIHNEIEHNFIIGSRLIFYN